MTLSCEISLVVQQQAMQRKAELLLLPLVQQAASGKSLCAWMWQVRCQCACWLLVEGCGWELTNKEMLLS
jgi:hypothetical protein